MEIIQFSTTETGYSFRISNGTILTTLLVDLDSLNLWTDIRNAIIKEIDLEHDFTRDYKIHIFEGLFYIVIPGAHLRVTSMTMIPVIDRILAKLNNPDVLVENAISPGVLDRMEIIKVDLDETGLMILFGNDIVRFTDRIAVSAINLARWQAFHECIKSKGYISKKFLNPPILNCLAEDVDNTVFIDFSAYRLLPVARYVVDFLQKELDNPEYDYDN